MNASPRYAARLTPVGTLIRFTFNDGQTGKAEHLVTREARKVRHDDSLIVTDHGDYTAGVHFSRVRGAVETVEAAPMPETTS